MVEDCLITAVVRLEVSMPTFMWVLALVELLLEC